MSRERNAGRDLDAQVASVVMGWTVEWLNAHRDYECGDWSVCQFCHPCDGSAPEHCDNPDESPQPAYNPPDVPNEWYRAVVPEFSTSIEAAWQVVEHFPLSSRLTRHHMAPWGNSFIYDAQIGEVTGSGDTAPLAICRAALKAAGSPHDPNR